MDEIHALEEDWSDAEQLAVEARQPATAIPEFTKKKYNGTYGIPLDSKVINCSGRFITKLPGPIELKFVEELEAKNNCLTELPYYAHLYKANVRGNRLKSLPLRMHYLRFLDISHNPLGSKYRMPDGDDLPVLEELYCRDTGLSRLAGRYPNLRVLECANNRITDLPAAENIPNITFIDCNYNKIKVIDYHEKLVTLWCAGNPNILIPDHLPKLVSLDCGGCKLRRMPVAKSIRYLNCRDNLIKTLESHSRQLIWLDCSKNKLQDLPEEVRGLRYLNASGNSFPRGKRLPLLLKVRIYTLDNNDFALWNPDKTALLLRASS